MNQGMASIVRPGARPDFFQVIWNRVTARSHFRLLQLDGQARRAWFRRCAPGLTPWPWLTAGRDPGTHDRSDETLFT